MQHLDATQVIVRRQAGSIQSAWRQIDLAGIHGSFTTSVLPLLLTAITAGQTQAAALAAPYVTDVLGDAPPADAVVPTVVPAAFAGLSSSGLPIAALSELVLFRLLADIGAGMSAADATARGLRQTLTYAGTEITDAGRTATQAQMITDTRVAGYERVVKLPACDRCIILAGRLYRFSTGFARHPRCDCTMRPVTTRQYRTADLANHPRALFDAMTEAEQNSRFGAGNAAAIRAGADLSQVVNARQGAMPVAGRWTTRSGTTNRGLAGQRMGQLANGGRYRRTQLARPTAGQLITDYGGRSRDELIAALRRYGYVL